jgi:hypothetical protein
MTAPDPVSSELAASEPASATRPVQGLPSCHWQIAQRYRAFFENHCEIDWFNLASAPGAVLVKANPNRQVWRVSLADRVFYAKVFRPAEWADRLRCLLRRRSQAQIEWEIGSYAESAGVSCVPFVACGLRKGPYGARRGVVITEELKGAVPLSGAWRQACLLTDSAKRRRALLALGRAAASLLARAHSAQFVHRDGHPGNILVSNGASHEARAAYVDLYLASIGRTVSDDRAAAAIAHLLQWSRRRTGRAIRLRFLRMYLTERFGARGASSPALRRWVTMIEDAGRRNAAVWWAKRDRRIRRRGKYFTRLSLHDGWCAAVTLTFRHRHEFPEPVHPDRTPDEWRDLLNAHLRGATAPTGTPLRENLGPPAVVERWHAAGIWQSCAWRLFGSPARRAFVASHRLRHRDLPAVWAVAVLERRTTWGVVECRLVTECRPTCYALPDLIAGTAEDPGLWREPRHRTAIMQSTGRLLADATLSTVCWPAPQLTMLCVEAGPDLAASPKALLGRFEHTRFRRAPDAAAGARTVLALARDLAGRDLVSEEDVGTLLASFRNRMGRAFQAPSGWPDMPNCTRQRGS